MTDLNRLGEELRAELGAPPASWSDRQRLRLRGLDVSPQASNNGPAVLMAALALGALVVGGLYYWPSTSGEPSASSLPDAAAGEAENDPQPGQPDAGRGEAIWVEADSKAATHRLSDGSSIELSPGTRGRVDHSPEFGTRFDLHEGTASFDVRKQKNREFSVVAGEYRVVVIGTRFSTAYVPPRKLSVTVDEGAVEVQLPDRSTPITVGSGEILDVTGREFSLRAQSAQATGNAEIEKTKRGETPRATTTEVSWRSLYRSGKYDDACKSARESSLMQLRASLGPAELTDLAGALRLCGAPSEAVTTLESLRKRHPSSPQARDALFLIGRIHATHGQPAAAISYLDKYLDAAAGGRFAAESLGRLIELHQARGNREVARTYASRYLQIAPRGPYRRLAESLANNP